MRLFICYRRVDGAELAGWLHARLSGRSLPSIGAQQAPAGPESRSSQLQIYFDTRAAAVADWTTLHQGELEAADALLVVVTPGLFTDFGEDDWVHRELRWWVRNRDTAPILVETTGEGARWIPAPVRNRWPNINRIELREEKLSQLTEAEAETVVTRILDGIRLDEDAAALRRLGVKRNPERWLMLAALLLLSLAGLYGWQSAWQAGQERDEAKRAREAAEKQVADVQRKALDESAKESLEARKESEPEKFRQGTGASKLWPTGSTLHVRFLDGTSEQKALVKQAFAQWTTYANLHVEYTNKVSADVRVSFKSGGSWSFVGTDALAVPDADPTLNLEYAEAGSIPRNYVHEVGHTLGLVHETSNPNAHLQWDKEAVYRELMGPPNQWTRKQIDDNFFSLDPYPGQRSFDLESIMLADMPGKYFKDGKPLVPGNVLSASDRSYVAHLYPRR